MRSQAQPVFSRVRWTDSGGSCGPVPAGAGVEVLFVLQGSKGEAGEGEAVECNASINEALQVRGAGPGRESCRCGPHAARRPQRGALHTWMEAPGQAAEPGSLGALLWPAVWVPRAASGHMARSFGIQVAWLPLGPSDPLALLAPGN